MAAVSSDTDSNRARETASGLHRDAVIDYQSLLAPRIPIVEATQIQLEPGCSPPDLTLFSSDAVWAVLADVHVASVGVTLMDPDYFAFALWAGEEECRLNGEPAQTTTLYAQGEQDGFYISGKARRTLGLAVRWSDLVEALAALRGVGPEHVALDDSRLELMPEAAARFRNALVDRVTQPLRHVSGSAPEADTSDLSSSTPTFTPGPSRAKDRGHIHPSESSERQKSDSSLRRRQGPRSPCRTSAPRLASAKGPSTAPFTRSVASRRSRISIDAG